MHRSMQPPHTIAPPTHLPRVLSRCSASQGYCSAYARRGVIFVTFPYARWGVTFVTFPYARERVAFVNRVSTHGITRADPYNHTTHPTPVRPEPL